MPMVMTMANRYRYSEDRYYAYDHEKVSCKKKINQFQESYVNTTRSGKERTGKEEEQQVHFD